MRILIIDGDGLIARAFRSFGKPEVPGIVFARGVSNSQCADEPAYQREMSLLLPALDLAKEINEPLVYFSGAPVYGDFAGIVTEATPCKPVTRYGRHQAECEELIRASNAPFLLARLSNAVGLSANHCQLFPSLVAQILSGHVHVQKFAKRDLIDVEDIVRSVQKLLSLGVTNEVVNIASGCSVAVAEIVRQGGELLGCRPAITEHFFGESQHFSICRLSSYIKVLPFDEDYSRRTLVRYTSSVADLLKNKVLDPFTFDMLAR